MSIFKFVYLGRLGTAILWIFSAFILVALLKTGAQMQELNSDNTSHQSAIEEVYESSEKEPS